MLLLLGFKCGSLFKIFRLNLTVLVLRQCRKKLKGFSSNDEVTRRLRKHDGQGPQTGIIRSQVGHIKMFQTLTGQKYE
jgi:hypothetical protein